MNTNEMFPPELLKRLSDKLHLVGPLPFAVAEKLAAELVDSNRAYADARAAEQGVPQADISAMLDNVRDTLVLMFTGQMTPAEVIETTTKIGERQAEIAWERGHR